MSSLLAKLKTVLRRPWGRVLALLCLALLGRLPAIHDSLWFDECASMDYARSPAPALVERLRTEDTHPPGYYLTLRAAQQVVPGDLGAHLLSLLINLAHVAVLAFLAARLWGARAGWTAAALAAVSPELAWPANEIRSFAMLGLLTTVAWLALVATLERGGWWRPLVAACALAAALYTFYYAALAGAALAAFVLAARFPARRMALCALAGAAALASLIPWLPVFREQFLHTAANIDRGSKAVAFDAQWIVSKWLVAHLVTLAPWGAVPGALLVPVAFVRWWRGPGRRLDAQEPRPPPDPRWLRATLVLCLVSVMLVPAAGWAGAFVGRRYGVFLAGAWCIAAAGLLERLPTRLRRALAIALVVAGALHSGVAAWNQNRADWRGAVGHVARNAAANDLVLVNPGDARVCWDHYAAPGAPQALRIPSDLQPPEAGSRPFRWLEAGDHVALAARLADRTRVWILVDGDPNKQGEDRGPALLVRWLAEWGWHRTDQHRFMAVRVERWEKP